MEQSLPCKLGSLEPETGFSQFCVTRVVNVPIFSRGSSADQILTWTTQPVRITDHESLASLSIVMDPQPFPRRFQGKIRSMTKSICNQGIPDCLLKPAFLTPSPNTWSATVVIQTEQSADFLFSKCRE